jgi:hypothetical protein
MRSGPRALVPIANIAGDPAPTRAVAGIVGIRQGEALGQAKLRFDEVQPGGFGGGEDGGDVELGQPPEEARVVMDVGEVVENGEDPPPRITGPEAPEGGLQVHHPLAFGEDPGQTVGVDVIEPQEVFHPVGPLIGRPQAMGAPLGGPCPAAQGSQFERPPLVEADHRRPGRAGLVERADGVFFRSKAGS